MRKEHEPLVKLLLTTSLMLASCGPAFAQPTRTPTPERTPTPTPQEPLATPTLIHNTPTPSSHATEVPVPSGYVRNGMTGALYQFTPNPEGKSGRCVKLGKYTNSNQQDVFGAATALGPNPGKYNDYPRFKVRGIGDFTTDALPDPGQFRIVQPGTIVCED